MAQIVKTITNCNVGIGDLVLLISKSKPVISGWYRKLYADNKVYYFLERPIHINAPKNLKGVTFIEAHEELNILYVARAMSSILIADKIIPSKFEKGASLDLYTQDFDKLLEAYYNKTTSSFAKELI